MFSGIIKGEFPIYSLNQSDDLLNYSVELDEKLVEGLEIGASVSVDGACQTVVDIQGVCVAFQAVPETLRCTHFGLLKVGTYVNIERSLSFGQELGGHLLSGHVFTTGLVKELISHGESKSIEIEVDEKYAPFLSEKGFIAVNGASLTVGKVTGSIFLIHLIPETLKITNLNKLVPSTFVNIEFDQQAVSIVTAVNRYLLERSI